MAYKKLIKVSNVCQVLDKSKFPATGTNNGITFTHNGDGSYTANGTFANSSGSYFYFTYNITLLANHKYLVLNGTYYEAGKYSVWLTVGNQLKADSNGTLHANDYNAKCYTPKKNEEANLSMDINHKPNVDTINFTFEPQLFDLTEMYGAGHEPTSVEQFRQDFPEEMYDYSPHCWLTSYKRVFMTKTKNLFDISKVTQKSSLQSDDKDIICSGYGTSIGLLRNLCPSLKVGDIVTLSLIVKSTTSVPPTFVQIQGQILNFEIGAGSVTFTVTEDGLNSDFYLYNTTFENRDVPTTTVFTDIMIELGDTATDYVPYGIIPSYQRNLTCKTKNLFDINSAEKYSGYSAFQKNGNQIIVFQSSTSRYVSANFSLDTSFVGKTITITALAKTSGINTALIRIDWLKDSAVEGKYILSNKITGNYFQKLTLTGVVPESTHEGYNTLGLMFYSNADSSLENGVTYSSTFTDIMIELGDTATSYVPYGHL